MFKISVNSEPSRQEVCQKSEQVFLCLSSQQSMILVSVKLWEGNKIHYQKMLWFIRKSLSLFIRSIVKINLEEYLNVFNQQGTPVKKSNFKTRMSIKFEVVIIIQVKSGKFYQILQTFSQQSNKSLFGLSSHTQQSGHSIIIIMGLTFKVIKQIFSYLNLL